LVRICFVLDGKSRTDKNLIRALGCSFTHRKLL